jgi:hypothetical protein
MSNRAWLRALAAAIVVLCLLAIPTVATSQVNDHLPPHPVCAVKYTQAQHRDYARAVYARVTISAKAKARLQHLRRCQHTPRAVHNTRAYERSLKIRADPRLLGRREAAQRGWVGEQWTCLDYLWTRESRWLKSAANPSGAYGIPQALPGAKMASAGPDWQTNPVTQIRWGLGYISGRYGTPCGAWAHSQATGWY